MTTVDVNLDLHDRAGQYAEKLGTRPAGGLSSIEAVFIPDVPLDAAKLIRRSADPDLIRAVWAKHGSFHSVRMSAASNVATPAAILEELTGDELLQPRAALTLRVQAHQSDDVFDVVHGGDPRVALAIAADARRSADELRVIRQNFLPDMRVAVALAENPATGRDDLLLIEQHARSRVARQSAGRALFRRRFGTEQSARWQEQEVRDDGDPTEVPDPRPHRHH